MKISVFVSKILAFLIGLGLTHPLIAAEGDFLNSQTDPISPLDSKKSWFELGDGATDYGPRNVYWRPLVSVILPGFDQYLSGQYGSGLAYSSVALGSRAWEINRQEKWDEIKSGRDYRILSKEEKSDFRQQDEVSRQQRLATQLADAVGFLSAYQSFRTSVVTQQKVGHYKFLTKEETPADLLAAPFEFKYLTKFTTLIPLAVVGAIGTLTVNHPGDDRLRRRMTGSDVMYSSIISYNAGVSEEAFIRGYIHPVLYESTDSLFLSNLAQSAIFAAAHLGSTNVPLLQFVGGYYLGWLNTRNDWTLSESIFIHTWWDVISLTTSYMTERKTNKNAALWLPAYRLAF